MNILAGIMLLASTACISATIQAEALPLEISIGEIEGVPIVQVSAVTDKIQLRGFTINRGNCKGRSIYQMPVDMVFGGQLKIMADGCNIREVTLLTDKGELVFSN